MGASVSKSVRTAETESPMHRNGLELLRRALDDFMCKVRSQNAQQYAAQLNLDHFHVHITFSSVTLTNRQILDELPHTVRGMGMTLLRPMIPEGRLPLNVQRRRDILANLLGFIVVVSALT